MSRLITAAIVAMLTASPALANDTPRGETVYKKCVACHAVGKGAKNTIAPTLNGIVGATAGTRPGFRYSKAVTRAGANGLVWNDRNLAEFMASPMKFLPGLRMFHVALKDESDIRSVIDYLKQFPDQ